MSCFSNGSLAALGQHGAMLWISNHDSYTVSGQRVSSGGFVGITTSSVELLEKYVFLTRLCAFFLRKRRIHKTEQTISSTFCTIGRLFQPYEAGEGSYFG